MFFSSRARAAEWGQLACAIGSPAAQLCFLHNPRIMAASQEHKTAAVQKHTQNHVQWSYGRTLTWLCPGLSKLLMTEAHFLEFWRNTPLFYLKMPTSRVCHKPILFYLKSLVWAYLRGKPRTVAQAQMQWVAWQANSSAASERSQPDNSILSNTGRRMRSFSRPLLMLLALRAEKPQSCEDSQVQHYSVHVQAAIRFFFAPAFNSGDWLSNT